MPSTSPNPRQQQVLDVALHRHLGLGFLHCAPGEASACFEVSAPHLAFGGLHGGVLYALMDAVGMLALLTQLDPARHAVTHDLHASMMRPAGPGERVVLRARVVRLGRSLAFVDVAAQVGETQIASARITKSIVAAKAGG